VRRRDVERRLVDLRAGFAAPVERVAVERFAVERFAVLRLAAGLRAADERLAPAPADLARVDVERFAVERFAVDRLAADLRAAGLRFAAVLRAGLAALLEPEVEAEPSIDHLPDITRCAASATASAMSAPNLVAL
jgi:hypothetical protein